MTTAVEVTVEFINTFHPIGMNVSGLGELSWKTDVFGVLGEFRSEFRSASAPLAQLVEQRTFNPQVLGSSPRGRTNGHHIYGGCGGVLWTNQCESIATVTMSLSH